MLVLTIILTVMSAGAISGEYQAHELNWQLETLDQFSLHVKHELPSLIDKAA